MKDMVDEIGLIQAVVLPIGMPPVVFIADPAALREVMSAHNIPKGKMMEFLEYGTDPWDDIGSGWLGRGLLSSNGVLWKSRRDLLTPTFHFQILQNYISIFQSYSQRFVQRLERRIEQGQSVSSHSFDIFPLCTDFTLDVIGACAFGIDLGAQNDKNSPASSTSRQEDPNQESYHTFQAYIDAVKTMSDLIWKRSFNALVHNRWVYMLTPQGIRSGRAVKILHELPSRLIEERKTHLQSHPEAIANKKRLDFLDLLLTVKDENGQGLDDQAIRSEANTFLFAAHDTTATSISWTLYCLASNLSYQKLVQDEIDLLLNDDRDSPSYDEAKSRLTMLELCIKESLRLYPPVPFLIRHTDEDLTLGGYQIPAGTEISVPVYAIHRLPQYWQEPDKFWPERFTLHGIKHPFAYIPFSAGHRSCIGQAFALLEEKIVLATLLKKFEFWMDDRLPPPELQTHIISRPSNGINVYFKRRQ